VRGEYAFSQRRACGLLTMAVSSYRYQTRRSDEPLRTKLVELAREKPRFGYRRPQVLLRRRGPARGVCRCLSSLILFFYRL
jgi:putative transposase